MKGDEGLIKILDESEINSRLDKYEGRVCCNCKSDETYIESNGTPHWYNCSCGKDVCTGYLCKRCYASPDWRYGDLDPSSASGKGFIGQQIVAKTYWVDDCNLKMNNFHFYVDISKISEYGYAEVKTASLIRGMWQIDTRRDQKYDVLIIICMDDNWPWRDVERVYIISWKYVILHGTGITIYKNPSRTTWIDYNKKKFGIDERPFNNVYHNMELKNCKVLRNDK